VATLPKITPLGLSIRPQPFDHPDWQFDLKYNGFRALLYLERGKRLADALPEVSRVGQAISVGERGSDFYEQVKAHDPAGIVAKRAAAPYARGVK